MCTGDTSQPVLQGVDVVAYFGLEPDAAPVQGTPKHTSEYMGYTFWFSSQENKDTFDVSDYGFL